MSQLGKAYLFEEEKNVHLFLGGALMIFHVQDHNGLCRPSETYCGRLPGRDSNQRPVDERHERCVRDRSLKKNYKS